MVTIPRKCVTLEIQMEGKTALPYLAEGESHGPVRILAIDEKSQSVRISNQGMLATLTFSAAAQARAQLRTHVPLQAKPLVNGPAHRETRASRRRRCEPLVSLGVVASGNFNPRTEVGEHTRPGCRWTRLASSRLAPDILPNVWNFSVRSAFSARGAENRTRGACAPHLNFGVRVQSSLAAPSRSAVRLSETDNSSAQRDEPVKARPNAGHFQQDASDVLA
jgi:hypothetical protein